MWPGILQCSRVIVNLPQHTVLNSGPTTEDSRRRLRVTNARSLVHGEDNCFVTEYLRRLYTRVTNLSGGENVSSRGFLQLAASSLAEPSTEEEQH